jgi:F-type H+-transporting ATPase subunit delta
MAGARSSTRRYAEAAFELALRDGTLEAWLEQLDRAAAVVADEQVLARLSNPAVPLDVRGGALTQALARAAGGDVLPQVGNLLRLLMRRRRLAQAGRVAADFRRLYNRRAGIVEATATSAAPLNDDEVRALRERIARLAGADRTVDLQLAVDPSLLGGITVRLGDTLVDGSVRGRLERLRSQLAART